MADLLEDVLQRPATPGDEAPASATAPSDDTGRPATAPGDGDERGPAANAAADGDPAANTAANVPAWTDHGRETVQDVDEPASVEAPPGPPPPASVEAPPGPPPPPASVEAPPSSEAAASEMALAHAKSRASVAARGEQIGGESPSSKSGILKPSGAGASPQSSGASSAFFKASTKDMLDNRKKIASQNHFLKRWYIF